MRAAPRWPFLVWALPDQGGWFQHALEALRGRYGVTVGASLATAQESWVETNYGRRASCTISRFLDDYETDRGHLVFRLVTIDGRCDHPDLPAVALRVEALGWRVLTLAQALDDGAPAKHRRATDEPPKGFTAPYGYCWMGGVVVPDEATAPVAQDIFKAALQSSALAIAKRLNDRGVAPPRTGQRWRASSVLNILNNRFYMGEPHDPLVSHRMFQSVAQALSRRIKRGSNERHRRPRL